MRKLTQWERGYLSGLVDSDGCVYFNKPNHNSLTSRLQVDNTSEKMMRKIKEIIGEGSYWESKRKIDRGLIGNSYRPIFRYGCYSNTLRWLLPQLNLVVKRGQQDLILEALPLFKRGRWKTEEQAQRLSELYREMKILNAKGIKRLGYNET